MVGYDTTLEFVIDLQDGFDIKKPRLNIGCVPYSCQSPSPHLLKFHSKKDLIPGSRFLEILSLTNSD